MLTSFRPLRCGAGALIAVVTVTGCAGRDTKQLALPAPLEAEVAVQAPAADKDALGNYRFLMQDASGRMSADQFDAWMKANGIRVAKGAPPQAPAPSKN